MGMGCLWLVDFLPHLAVRLVPQARGRSAAHRAQRQGAKLVYGLLHRCLGIAQWGGREMGLASWFEQLRGRQGDQAVRLHAQQRHAAGHVLDLSVGLDPGEHGFRSTFRDWAGETTAYPREVVEHALAHQLKDQAEAAYARGTLFDKRRGLMSDWATFCDTAA